ncbi:HET domain protein [Colletotrichum tofieldiae]|nr:HET domain protein [Colletotrichum tofieldiae]
MDVWGIPFAGSLSALDGLSPSPLERALFSSEQAMFGYSLAWYSTHSSLRRRCDFPTWSWVSCRGSVEFMSLPFGIPDCAVIPDPEVIIWFECDDGKLTPFANYMLQSPAFQLSQYLHIEAWSVRDGLTFHHDEGRVTIDVGDEKYHLTANIGMDALPDEHDQKPVRDLLMGKEGWEAIVVFFSPEDNNDSVQPFIITVIRVDDPSKPFDEVYERIGHIKGLRLEKISKKSERTVRNLAHDVLGGKDISNAEPETRPPTVGWAAKALDDQARENREAEEAFSRFREGLRLIDQLPQLSAVSNKRSDASEGSDLRRLPAPDVDTNRSSSGTSESKLAYEELDDKDIRKETLASGSRKVPLPMGNVGNTSGFLKLDEAVSDAQGEFQGQTDQGTDDVGVGTHTTDTSSSSDADSDDHGDYMINMIVRRGHIKRLFPRIPMTRRKLIMK